MKTFKKRRSGGMWRKIKIHPELTRHTDPKIPEPKSIDLIDIELQNTSDDVNKESERRQEKDKWDKFDELNRKRDVEKCRLTKLIIPIYDAVPSYAKKATFLNKWIDLKNENYQFTLATGSSGWRVEFRQKPNTTPNLFIIYDSVRLFDVDNPNVGGRSKKRSNKRKKRTNRKRT